VEGPDRRQRARLSRGGRRPHCGELQAETATLLEPGDGQFFDLSSRQDPDSDAHASRGLAVGDLDNDGTKRLLSVTWGAAILAEKFCADSITL